VLVYHAVAFWIPSLGGLLAYSLLRRQLPGIRTADDDTQRADGGELRPATRTFSFGETGDVAAAATAHRLELPEPTAARVA
jgi:hypothetical protein